MSPVSAVDERRQFDGALVRGLGIVALFATVNGLARIGQDAAIAWRFGTGPLVDAYYFVVSLVNWPIAVALSVMTVLVAPADTHLRSRAPEAARNFRAELFGLVVLAALATLPLAWWIMQVIAGGTAGGLESGAAALAHAGVPGVSAAVPLGIVASLLSAWFISAGRHVLTLLEALPPLVLIAALMAMPGKILFWGTSAGIAAQVLVMLLLLRMARDLPMPRLRFASPAWHHLWRGACLILVGQVLFSFVPLIDAFFAAREGDGTVGTLSYANRLVLGLQGVAGLALQRAGLPLLTRLSAQSPSASLTAARRWALTAAGAGGLLALTVAWLAGPLVSLLFERGSFTGADRDEVAVLLRYGMLQIPAFLGGITLVTALASMQARRALAWIAVVGLVTKLLLCVALVPSQGAVGLQLATAAMYIATCTFAWVALQRHSARKQSNLGRADG